MTFILKIMKVKMKMTISSISIKNVKGIQNRTFDLNISPNKPSLLVAPNGFGKSSIAIAFASLRSNRVELHDDHFFENDQNNLPEITIKYKKPDNTIVDLIADSSSNAISDEFSYFVINSQVKANGIGRSFGGRNIVTASLEIEAVTLIDTIPERCTFGYSYSSQKSYFNKNGKVLPNISGLFDNLKLVMKLSELYSEFDAVLLVRNQKIISNFIKNVDLENGTREQLFAVISASHINLLLEIESLKKIAETIKDLEATINNSLVQAFLAAIQIANVYQSDKVKFKKACKYCSYKLEVDSYTSLLKSFNTTWKEIKPEVNGRSLVVKFPKVQLVSNGQRDILSFISLIIRAKRRLNKDKCILIIDEVFDYLDDANLISAQYYVTKLIDEYKKDGKEIYPLILTHLNPRYFKNYAFSKQKVYYLDKRDGSCVSNHLIKLLIKRNEASIKDDVSKYLLHFHPEEINKKSEFQQLGIKASWGAGDGFKQFIDTEMQKFLSDSHYDPLAVCCGVRRKIEEIVYADLSTDESKITFLDEHGTKNKLQVAEECGVIVPEYFYLLGIIYNDGMHWKENQDNVSPIAAKLENMTIKKLITDAFGIIGGP